MDISACPLLLGPVFSIVTVIMMIHSKIWIEKTLRKEWYDCFYQWENFFQIILDLKLERID